MRVETWKRDRAKFPAMGGHIAEMGIEAMEWADAPDDEVARVRTLIGKLEHDEYGQLPENKWGQRLPNRKNEALLDQAATIVDDKIGFAMLGVQLKTWLMGPACIANGIVDEEAISDAGFDVEINDHGNVTLSWRDHTVWECV